MIEFLLLSFCISRTSDGACFTGARAYSQQYKIDKMIENYGNEINKGLPKELMYTGFIASTIQSQSFSAPLFNHLILNLNNNNNGTVNLIYKKGF